jgi:hypothetical protein
MGKVLPADLGTSADRPFIVSLQFEQQIHLHARYRLLQTQKQASLVLERGDDPASADQPFSINLPAPEGMKVKKYLDFERLNLKSHLYNETIKTEKMFLQLNAGPKPKLDETQLGNESSLQQ